jgi:Ca2+-binding EF-hand superfamily protein
MNSISLTQVTLFVVAVSMASFFVNANEASGHSTKTAHTEFLASPEAAEKTKELTDKFTFTSLDNDKNGKLSQQEVLSGKNEWLVRSFKKIDSNADKALTEQELVDFVAKTTAATK